MMRLIHDHDVSLGQINFAAADRPGVERSNAGHLDRFLWSRFMAGKKDAVVYAGGLKFVRRLPNEFSTVGKKQHPLVLVKSIFN